MLLHSTGLKKLYAVLTGDLVGSSNVDYKVRLKALDAGNLQRTSLGGKVVLFNVFRGDSFQSVLSSPEKGLVAAVVVRAILKSENWGGMHLDARIAVGIGSVDYLPKKNTGMGDGEAFQNSGRLLDRLKGKGRMLGVSTPWEGINEELEVEVALLDDIVRGWSPSKAETALHWLVEKSQKVIAKSLGISQPSVSKRLAAAKMDSVEIILKRYEQLLEKRVDSA